MPIVTLASGSTGTVPAAPTLVSVTAGNGGAAATWTAPASDGGSSITGYLVTARSGATGVVVLTQSAAATATTVNLAPLDNDTAYAVTVSAVNGFGASQQSNQLTVTPTGGGGVVTPPPVDTTPRTTPQPLIQAFPASRAFRPGNWRRSAEETVA